MVTQSCLHELFDYDPLGGNLIWRKSGKIAGSNSGRGYIQVRIDGKCYRRSRLVWLYHKGQFPSQSLDHINRNRSDDRIENLRECTHRQNAYNAVTGAKVQKFRGVKKPSPSNRKWVARLVKPSGERVTVWADTEFEAAIAYDQLALHHHGEFATVNFPCLWLGD